MRASPWFHTISIGILMFSASFSILYLDIPVRHYLDGSASLISCAFKLMLDTIVHMV